MRFIFALVLSLLTFSAGAAQLAPLPLQECIQQAPFGFPGVNKKIVSKICRKAYFVVHDNKAKIPVYVSYVLTPEHATGCLKRKNAFRQDKSVMGSTPKDYAKSKYNIGHLANSADMLWDVQVEEDSFILSNMAPQLPEFNRGIWKKLEDRTRGWAISRQHTLLIYTGPIYDAAQDPVIGVGRVTVPHAFFKIITDLDTSESQVFIMKHEGSKQDLGAFITSLAEVQRQTGIVFAMPVKVKYTKLWKVDAKSATKTKSSVCSLN